jgi:hypothetical protein
MRDKPCTKPDQQKFFVDGLVLKMKVILLPGRLLQVSWRRIRGWVPYNSREHNI